MYFRKQRFNLIHLILIIFIFQVVRSDFKCQDSQILDIDQQNCIYPSQCLGVIYNNRCLEQCPPDLLPHYSYYGLNEKLTSCYSYCQENYYVQLYSKACKFKKCDDGYPSEETNKCMKQEECITINFGKCSQKCEKEGQVLLKQDGIYQCRFCLGYVEKDKSGKQSTHCVSNCSSEQSMLVANNGYSCATIDGQSKYLISSDKKYYTDKCKAPEISANINGVQKCVTQCPQSDQVILIEGNSLSCIGIESCNSKSNRKLSSNNKYCLSACYDLQEVEKTGYCQKCFNGEQKSSFFSLDIKTSFYCETYKSDKNDLKLRLNNFLFQSKYVQIILKEQYDYFVEQLSAILFDIEINNLISDALNQMDLRSIIFALSKALDDQFCFSPMVFKSNKIKIISQKLYLQQPSDYNRSFSFSKLKSDNPDNLKIPNKTLYRQLEFFPNSLFFVISETNYLCRSPQICFINSELVQVFVDETYQYLFKSYEYDIVFDNIDVKNINKYVCLTTIYGIMSKSLKTEVINNSTAVKCTFRDNVTLFLDSDGLFVEKDCPKDKPYILSYQCVESCPDLVDLFTKRCVSTSVECSYNLESGKYCVDKCPEQSPYKSKGSYNQTICQKSCYKPEIQFQDSKECQSKEACKEYLIDEKICSKQCPHGNYVLINQETPYQSCNSSCKLFSYQLGEQQICSSSCLQNHIVDNEAKKCYNEKQQCLKFITSNGKECISKCANNQYFEVVNGYRQCRICRDIIKQENNIKKCVTECGEDEMIFQLDTIDISRICVKKDFCSKRMISAKNKNMCMNICAQPEINYGYQCIESCPEGSLYSTKDNSCSNSCNYYYSSDEKLCVETCDQVFEIIDELDQTNKKKCKKCASNEYFSQTTDDKGLKKVSCKPIKNTEESLETMKKDLFHTFETSTAKSVKELEASLKVVNLYAAQIQTKLKDLTNKSELSSQDLSSAQSAIKSVLDITKSCLSSVNSQISDKPAKVSTEEFTVTAQVAQPGKRFKTIFTSSDIKSGISSSLLELDPDESSTKFTPQILQATYLKKSFFCIDARCKEFPPLFVVTYEQPQSKRILEESVAQQFEITYQISQEQDPEKIFCLSFSQDGKVVRLKGEAKNNEIKCKFEYSSALYYDNSYQNKNSNFKDQEDKISNNSKDQDSESETFSGGVIAGIVIGSVVFVALIISGVVYFKRKRRDEPKKAYMVQNQNQTDNKETNTVNDVEKIAERIESYS